MCGIAGIIASAGTQPESEQLETLRRLIAHRGPDDSDIVVEGRAGLVHTRLSIQDLSNSAHQPMWSEDRRHCLCYNGEIYNFRELRRELEAAGHRFRSTGDTEVLLRACIEWGVEATLPRLDGMFAFALYEVESDRLWLARDRMGIKPLYYAERDDRLIFASEMKAVRALLGEVAPDLPVILSLLEGASPWEPWTPFQGILALQPGHFMCIDAHPAEVVQQPYFRIIDAVDEALYREQDGWTLQQATDRFRSLMTRSVEIHAISDAPVAALASGGIDSSLISALAQKFIPDIALYHADVVGPMSERAFARQVAEYLDAPFHAAEMHGEDYVSSLVETTWYHEMPSAYHPNDVPFQLVARLAHENGIKVLLTGEGADELFLGYGPSSKAILRDRIASLFALGRPLLGRLGGLLGKLYPPARRRSVIEDLASRAGIQAWRRESESAYAFVHDPVERNALIDGLFVQRGHLNSLLQRNDRMGMMHALESRIPFLENEVVRFAVNLPVRFKHPMKWREILRGNPLTRNKTVVRRAARDLVPESITTRKKLGFPVTPMDYLRLDAEFLRDGFLQHLLGIGHEGMKASFEAADDDLRWNLFSVELFGRLFFLGEDRAMLQQKILAHARH